MQSPVYFEDETSVYERGTDEWWAEKAQLPVGQRRKVKYGKVWPERPRPDLPKQPFIHKYHAAHAWPQPYVCDDREYMRSVFEQQTANGWSTETTLYSYHFDAESNELNIPGQKHLNWILNVAPPQFRSVYLQRDSVEHVNQMRLASVQRSMGDLSMGEAPPRVEWRSGLPIGRSAAAVQAMQTLEAGALPVPVVGGIGGGGGGGAGGGAAGGGGGGAAGGTGGTGT